MSPALQRPGAAACGRDAGEERAPAEPGAYLRAMPPKRSYLTYGVGSGDVPPWPAHFALVPEMLTVGTPNAST